MPKVAAFAVNHTRLSRTDRKLRTVTHRITRSRDYLHCNCVDQ